MLNHTAIRGFAYAVALTAFGPSLVSAETLLRGPYLQQGDSDSIIVKWRSDVPTDSRVEFGTSQHNLNRSTVNTTWTTEHEVEIEGLAPSTRYYYNIGDTRGVLAGGDANHFFETSPARGSAASTRIWVIGDAGTANSNQAAVYNAYRNYTGSHYTNLWLMLGDNAYPDGTDAQYQKAVFDMYPELLRKTPLWSTLGNHDGRSADSSSQSGSYYDIFSFPRNAEVGGVASGTEAYYSFDYGHIHFIVLDSHDTSRSTSGAMMNWLLADLQNVTADWLVAFWHHPPYSKGSHNSDTERRLIDMRRNFLPVLENYGVDLVLSGHSHSYERSKFINGHYGSSDRFTSSHEIDGGSGRRDGTGAYVKHSGPPNSGAVYAVAGASGGTRTKGARLNHPAMYISLKQLGSMVIDVNGLTMDVKYVNNVGAVTDYFTITKDTTPTTPPAAPSNLTATPTSTSAITLTWSDNADTETGFELERSIDSVNWNQVGTAGVNATRHTDSLLTANTTYYYRLRAINSGGPSGYGNISDATTHPTRPTQTVILRDGHNGYSGTQDSYISSGASGINWGNSRRLNADGSDGTNGELISLVQWDLSSIPSTSNVTEVNVSLEVFNASGGSYGLYAMNEPWNESSVTWNNTNLEVDHGSSIGTLLPNVTGSHTLSLNSAGVTLVQGWVDGTIANNGLLIRSTRTSDGVDMRSSEYGTVAVRPTMRVTYETSNPHAPPVRPHDLVAKATSHDAIELSWTDNSDNETGFDIERSLDSRNWSLVATLSENSSHHTDTGLNELSNYYYRVVARNGVGYSDYSNIASATTHTSIEPMTVVFRNGLNGYSGTRDSYVASQKTDQNYGNSSALEADGRDGSNGELVTLVQWDVSSVPANASIVNASVTLKVSNRSSGRYGIYAMNGSWSEHTVTWSNAQIDSNQGIQTATFNPASTVSHTLALNAEGVGLVQSWVDGTVPNNGLMLRTLGTIDGMISASSEYGRVVQRPTLILEYQ